MPAMGLAYRPGMQQLPPVRPGMENSYANESVRRFGIGGSPYGGGMGGMPMRPMGGMGGMFSGGVFGGGGGMFGGGYGRPQQQFAGQGMSLSQNPNSYRNRLAAIRQQRGYGNQPVYRGGRQGHGMRGGYGGMPMRSGGGWRPWENAPGPRRYLSDHRTKKDVKDFEGTELLDKIKVYDFAWKDRPGRSHGVLAHELQEVLPQLVNGEKDGFGFQTVVYDGLIPILVKAVQELSAEVKSLREENSGVVQVV